MEIEESGGKQKEQGRRLRTTNRVIPSSIYKIALARRAQGQGERQQEKHAAWKRRAVVNSGKTTFCYFEGNAE